MNGLCGLPFQQVRVSFIAKVGGGGLRSRAICRRITEFFAAIPRIDGLTHFWDDLAHLPLLLVVAYKCL